MTLAWVVGSGGLLGSALCRALGDRGRWLHSPGERFDWRRESELGAQFSSSVRRFAANLPSAGSWEIYWAAGVSSMGSSEDDLAAETRSLSLLLEQLRADPRVAATPGTVAFASSAGAIYGGSDDFVITEDTPPAPNTAYARAKLDQESRVRQFVLSHGRAGALLARLSTLYGRGQSSGKRQGLIAHIARSMLRNRPVQIFVPLDTVRDYMNADDAAASIVAMMDGLLADGCRERILTRIVASERPTTIAEIVSIFRRITRRAPRIVTSASRLSSLYPRHVRFRSVVGEPAGRRPTTPLLSGISDVMNAERAGFVRATVGDGR